MSKQPSNVREAVGIFFEADHVLKAAEDLRIAGFSDEEIGLLVNKDTVGVKLKHLYEEVEGGGADAPDVAFVRSDGDDPHARAFLGSLSFVGAAAVGGTLVASAALLGSPLLVGAASVAFGGGIAGVMSRVLSKSDADFLDEQLEAGHMLLFARIKNDADEKSALNVLKSHDAYESRVLTIDESTTDKGFSTEH